MPEYQKADHSAKVIAASQIAEAPEVACGSKAAVRACFRGLKSLSAVPHLPAMLEISCGMAPECHVQTHAPQRNA